MKTQSKTSSQTPIINALYYEAVEKNMNYASIIDTCLCLEVVKTKIPIIKTLVCVTILFRSLLTV